MDTFLTALASILVGVVATIWVFSHYYRRSTKKSLTPYIQFSTSVFRGVESTLREALKIHYKDVPVTDLFEIQFLIANTGHRPIRDLIEPLTVDAPNGCEILDASILHIHPAERHVHIDATESVNTFRFPLLNADEFFIAKLLLKGQPNAKEFKFRISVDDLPPILKPSFLPPELIDTGEKRTFEKGLFLAGLVVLAIGSAVAGLIYGHWSSIEAIWTDGLLSAVQSHWLIILSASITVLPALILLVIGPMLLIGAFTNFTFPKSRKFPVPSDYARSPLFWHRIHSDEIALNQSEQG
jgi:hypothetical protein